MKDNNVIEKPLTQLDLEILKACEGNTPKSCKMLSDELSIPIRSIRRHVATLREEPYRLLNIGDGRTRGLQTEWFYLSKPEYKKLAAYAATTPAVGRMQSEEVGRGAWPHCENETQPSHKWEDWPLSLRFSRELGLPSRNVI